MTDKSNATANWARQALMLFAGYGASEALVWEDRRLTYDDIRAGALTMVASLWHRGIRPGMALCVLARNTPDSLLLQLGAHLLGCRTAWVGHHTPARFGREFLRLSKADVLLYDALTLGELGRDFAAAADTSTVLCLGAGGLGADLLAEEPNQTLPIDLEMVDHEPESLFQTSGTTGTPKLVHHRNNFFQTLLELSAGYAAEDSWRRHLVASDVLHAGSQTGALMTLFMGGTLLLDNGRKVETALELIGRERVTSTLITPPDLYTLLDGQLLDDADLSSLQSLTVAASAAAPSRLAQAIERFGPVIRIVYGMSEAPMITALPNLTIDPAHPERLASCGLPVAGSEVEIRDGDGNTCPVGVPGEVCVHGPLVMSGYWGAPELTARTLVDGWLHTGDVGYLDEDGYLFLVDRLNDMVITGMGSNNVYCRVVEDALLAHPQVRAAAVIGVPDALFGEAVHAYVVPAPGATVTGQELRQLVATELSETWSPREVEFIDALPIGGLGKVDKKALRAQYSNRSTAYS